MPSLILQTGRRLTFEHFGDPRGVPAFYFHGWPSSRVQGELMHDVCLEAGLSVVCMDRPGVGDSDFHPHRRLLDWPPLLAELADHLGWSRFHLFGVSGGGPYVHVSALTMPARILSAHAICGAPPLNLMGTQDLFWPYRLALVLRQKAPGLLGPAFRVATAISYQKPGQIPLRWLTKTMCEADRMVLSDLRMFNVVVRGMRECLRRGVECVQADGDIYTGDWGFDLRDVQFPVHVWHGRADTNIPWSYAERVAARLATGIPHWTPDDGHYSLPVRRLAEIVNVAVA